jgi:hypothetical protein
VEEEFQKYVEKLEETTMIVQYDKKFPKKR